VLGKKQYQGVVLVAPLEGPHIHRAVRDILPPILRLLLRSMIDGNSCHTGEVIELTQRGKSTGWDAILTIWQVWLIGTPRRGMSQKEIDRLKSQAVKSLTRDEGKIDVRIVTLPWPENQAVILKEINRLPPSLVRRYLES
jgi:hypothetical protein